MSIDEIGSPAATSNIRGKTVAAAAGAEQDAAGHYHIRRRDDSEPTLLVTRTVTRTGGNEIRAAS